MKGGHILEQKDIEEVLSMSNAYFTISRPVNDPFLGYLPGSSEREERKRNWRGSPIRLLRFR